MSAGLSDEVTKIVYVDAEKKVVIDRSRSSSANWSPFCDYEGQFYLYDALSDVCDATREKLSLLVFVDALSVTDQLPMRQQDGLANGQW